MHKSIFIFIIVLFLLPVFGCKEQKLIHEHVYIVAVWKHGVDSYSVTYQDENKFLRDVSFSSDTKSDPVERVADLADGEKMWYEADYYYWGEWKIFRKVKIHIHSVNDLTGAGWNHGKHGSGRTEKVDVEKPD